MTLFYLFSLFSVFKVSECNNGQGCGPNGDCRKQHFWGQWKCNCRNGYTGAACQRKRVSKIDIISLNLFLS